MSPPGALAIAINQAGRASERFIERHIRESFGGRTVVVARHAGGAPDYTQPVLVSEPSLLSLPARLATYARHAYWGVPVGAQRAALRAFWRDHRVFAVLAEFGPLGCWIAPVAREHGVPVFVYFRGYDASRKLRSAQTVRAYRHMVGQVDGMFAVSRFLIDNLARVGVEHRNTHVIPSGTNPRVFRPGKKEHDLVVSVGRLVQKKRPDVTVRSFARMARAHPSARLEMVGDGPMLASCRELAASMGVADRVLLHGAREHAFVVDLLARAHIYAQHSVTDNEGETEGLPSSIQEAMAAGAGIVSTRHAGIPEAVIEGQTGWLVDEHDEDGYTRALEKAMADPARTAAMGRAARRFAENNLDTQELQRRLEAVITAAVSAR